MKKKSYHTLEFVAKHVTEEELHESLSDTTRVINVCTLLNYFVMATHE